MDLCFCYKQLSVILFLKMLVYNENKTIAYKIVKYWSLHLTKKENFVEKFIIEYSNT